MKKGLIILSVVAFAACGQADQQPAATEPVTFADVVSSATYTRQSGDLASQLRFAPGGAYLSLSELPSIVEVTNNAEGIAAALALVTNVSPTQSIYAQLGEAQSPVAPFYGVTLSDNAVSFAPYMGVESPEAVDFTAEPVATYQK
ncbi:MAG: hypothetical protein ACRCY4_10815 [Brevinema sp.]